MKKNSKRPFIRSPLQDNILSLTAIVSLMVLTLAAVSVVLWMLNRVGMISIDQNPFDAQTTETMHIDHADGIFEILRPISDEADVTGGMDSPDIVRFSGSFSTLRTLLSDLNIPDQYHAQFETVLYSDTSAVKNTVRMYRSGNAYRINRYAPGTSAAGSPTDYYVCDGSAVGYTDNRTGATAHFPISTTFSPEALAGIPSIASFNEIPDEQILHASYTVLDGELVYYVLYITPTASDHRIVHEIWISADTELVMRCNTYLCGKNENPMNVIEKDRAKLFSSVLTHVSELTERERRSMFRLPQLPS